MTNKTIERYIQFGIDNGFKLFGRVDIALCYESVGMGSIQITSEHNKEITYSHCNITELITSGPFINAIARGYVNDKGSFNLSNGKLERLEQVDNHSSHLSLMIEFITGKQALAIRDNNMEEFILNILPKE